MNINWLYDFFMEYANHYMIGIGLLFLFTQLVALVVNYLTPFEKEVTSKELSLQNKIFGTSIIAMVLLSSPLFAVKDGFFDYENNICFVGNRSDKFYQERQASLKRYMKRLQKELDVFEKNKLLLSQNNTMFKYLQSAMLEAKKNYETFQSKDQIIQVMFLETKTQDPIAITNYNFGTYDNFENEFTIEYMDRGELIGKNYDLKQIDCNEFIRKNASLTNKQLFKTVLNNN